MITPWTIYWITRLDVIKAFFLIPATMILIAATIMGIASLVEYTEAYGRKEEIEKSKSYFKRCLYLSPIGLFLIFLGGMVPSTKTMAAILVLPKIINNEKVQQLPDNLLDLANKWIEELKPVEKKP